jgi:exopolysaccharide production protein ExoZ
MPNDRTKKFRSLEICRFLAAFSVMVEHQILFITSVHIGKPGALWQGLGLPAILAVLFFFVLSGFVMMTAHGDDFGKIERIPRFAWRRFCRIYPLYWLSLPLWLYLLWGSSSSLGYLFKIFTLYPFQTQFLELNSPAWTLRFEVSFYLMFAISLLPVIGRFWLAAWIVLVFWNWFPGLFIFHAIPGATRLHTLIPAALDWHFFGIMEVYFFAGLGAGLAYRHLHWPKIVNWAVLAVSILALVYLNGLSSWKFAYPSVDLAPFIALAFACFIFALSALERSQALRIGAWGERLGDMSYPVYILHFVPIFLMMSAFFYHPNWRNAWAPLPLLACFLATTLPLIAAVTFFVDRPMQRAFRNMKFVSVFRAPAPAGQTRS